MARPSLSKQWRYLKNRQLSQQVKRASQSVVSAITLRLPLGKILIVAGILAALAATVVAFYPTTEWTATVALRVAVTVLDCETRDPIPGARVLCKLPATDPRGRGELDPARFDTVLATGETDAHGRAEFEHSFTARGTTSARGRRGRIIFDENIRAEAPGYRACETPLAMLVETERPHTDRSTLEVKLSLYRP